MNADLFTPDDTRAIVLSFVRESSQGDRPRRLIESLRGR